MLLTDLGDVSILLFLLSLPLPDHPHGLLSETISRSFAMFELFEAIFEAICSAHGGHEPVIIIMD